MDDLDFNQVEAEPLHVDQDYFKLHIREVGSNKRSAGYNLMQSQSALELAFRGSTSICRDLVGKNDAPALRYELALFLLSTLEGDSIKGENLEENIQEIKEEAHSLDEDEFDTSPHAEVAKESFAIIEDGEGESQSD